MGSFGPLELNSIKTVPPTCMRGNKSSASLGSLSEEDSPLYSTSLFVCSGDKASRSQRYLAAPESFKLKLESRTSGATNDDDDGSFL